MSSCKLEQAPLRRALFSVSDKSGLVELGSFLARRGVEIIASRGSAQTLIEAEIPVRSVEELTGTAELAGGRVKTLHHLLHAGILAERKPDAEAQYVSQGILLIDLVVVNLYPFEQVIRRDPEAGIEAIDIGGSALIRAAAKNHAYVTVVTEPKLYSHLMAELLHGQGVVSGEFRQHLAQKAFAYTAAHDAAISTWMAQRSGIIFPEQLTISARRQQILRYGENPHQKAALYAWTSSADEPATAELSRSGAGATESSLAESSLAEASVAEARQIQGRQISYNNLSDADAAWRLVTEFSRPAIAIVKHTNPCGVAEQNTLVQAWHRALACDRLSAFGAVVATNQTLDQATAAELAEQFIEVLIAPAIDDDALNALSHKRNLRILLIDAPSPAQFSPCQPLLSQPSLSQALQLYSIAGGLLIQSADKPAPAEQTLADSMDSLNGFQVVTKRPPSAQERSDLLFAWQVAKHVKSNAIVLASAGASVGIGAGQMSRVAAVECAVRCTLAHCSELREAEPSSSSIVAASDAFFPFADGLIKAHEAGVTAVIQPGGSRRDEEVIAAAIERSMAMVFTGIRHFRH